MHCFRTQYIYIYIIHTFCNINAMPQSCSSYNFILDSNASELHLLKSTAMPYTVQQSAHRHFWDCGAPIIALCIFLIECFAYFLLLVLPTKKPSLRPSQMPTFRPTLRPSQKPSSVPTTPPLGKMHLCPQSGSSKTFTA